MCHKKHASTEVLSLEIQMSVVKKIFICKEKSRTVKKVKLVIKIKKLNQLYFGALVLASFVLVEIMHKIWTSFKTLASKKAGTWHLKKSLSNDRLLWKVMSSSYHLK